MFSEPDHGAILAKGWAEGVGFFRRSGRLQVSFPKVYDGVAERLLSNRDFRLRHTILLVRTLHRYCLDPSVPAGELVAAFSTSDTDFLDWLSAAAALLDEYLENGLYWVKETRFVRDQAGPISWSRTLAKSGELLEGGTPFYLSPVYRSRTRSRDGILFRLHASLVEEISLWLTGVGLIEGGSPMEEAELSAVRLTARPLIDELLRSTFSDRGKALLKLISRYLQASSEGHEPGEGASLLCRSENFELIWEHMLRSVVRVSGLPGISQLPEGIWKSRDNRNSRGVRPRIDFSYGPDPDHGIVIVFDAKDKVVREGARSGSEQDHYKQIIYTLLSGLPRVESALVFPTLGAEPGAYPLKLIGSHEWLQLLGSRVHEVAASYVAICNAYLERRTFDPAILMNQLLESPQE